MKKHVDKDDNTYEMSGKYDFDDQSEDRARGDKNIPKDSHMLSKRKWQEDGVPEGDDPRSQGVEQVSNRVRVPQRKKRDESPGEDDGGD